MFALAYRCTAPAVDESSVLRKLWIMRLARKDAVCVGEEMIDAGP